MRISDWSSDVCSSDLAAAHALEQAIGRGHLESAAESTCVEVEHDAVRIVELEQLVVDRPGYVEYGPRVIGSGPDAQGLDPGGRYGAEIGRAWGRGSVWQYVDSAGVAGS